MNKICHITTVHSRYDTRIFQKECISLSKHYDVSLIVADGLGNETKENIKIIDIGKRQSSRIKRMHIDPKKAFKKAVELDAEVYHFHDPELLPIGLKLKRKGKKVIYDAHEDLPNDILAKQWIPKYLRKPFSIFVKAREHYYVRKIDGVVTVINPIKKRLQQINNNVVVCANYASLWEFSVVPTWITGKNRICYIGGINKIRGIVQVIEATEKAHVVLELAGNFGPKELEQELKNMNGWKNVNYHGFVGRKEMDAIFNLSIAGIITFIPAKHNQEASPNKLFEYMAAGLPIIASNLPYAENVILPTKSGICVDPKSSDEIASAIRYLIDNPKIAKEMGENARKAFEEKYNWQNEEEKLINLYLTILKVNQNT